jgi:hypothetical protein
LAFVKRSSDLFGGAGSVESADERKVIGAFSAQEKSGWTNSRQQKSRQLSLTADRLLFTANCLLPQWFCSKLKMI